MSDLMAEVASRIELSLPDGQVVGLRWQNHSAIRGLVAGWCQDALSTIFAPLLLLELRSLIGHSATWFIDASGTYLSDRVEGLPPWAKERIRKFVAGGITLPEDINPTTRCHIEALGRDDVCHDPVFEEDGELRLRQPDGRVASLRDGGGRPITHLGTGWAGRLLYTGIEGLQILELQHEQLRATWFLDSENRLLAHSAENLSAPVRSLIRTFGEGLVGDIAKRDDFLHLLNLETRARIEAVIPRPARADVLEHGQAVAALAMASSKLDLLEEVSRAVDSNALPNGWKAYPDGQMLAVGPSCSIMFNQPACMYGSLELDFVAIRSRRRMVVEVNGAVLAENVLDPDLQPAGVRLHYWLKPGDARADRVEVCLRFIPPPRADEHVFEFEAARLYGKCGDISDELPPGELLSRFQSLGDNCEFGFVQRHFGIEPMGLFRFAGVGSLRALLDMLASRFAGLGGPGSIRLGRFGNEHMVLGNRYGLRYHTFRYVGQVEPEQVLRENEVKLSYLGRKVLEDIEDGEAIWVYKRQVTQDINEIQAIHNALNRIAPSKLLWVIPAGGDREPASVEWLGPNLLRGCVDRISTSNAESFTPEIWLELCRNAYEAFRNAARAVGP